MNSYIIASIILTLITLFVYINTRFLKIQPTIAVTIESLLLSIFIIILGKLGFPHLQHQTLQFLHRVHFKNLLINGLLSFLLFAGTLRIDTKHLKTHHLEIGILSVIGTLLSTLLIGGCLYFILNTLANLSISFISCMLFGALISPTDPVAALGILKSRQIPGALKTIIEGESLFNDGIGLIIFLALYQIATAAPDLNWIYFLKLSVQQIIGGLLYGGILGIAAVKLIKSIKDYKTIMLITLTIVTAGYTSARYLGVSGPLSMITAGIIIGENCRLAQVNDFWELIEDILDGILFLLIGLEIFVIPWHFYFIISALAAVVTTLLARWIIVSVSVSLNKNKYPEHATSIITWSGLRGGLALALALTLPTTLPWEISRGIILNMTYTVVAFSIVAQGLTIKHLVRYLSAKK